MEKVDLIVPRASTGRWNGRIGLGIFKTLIETVVDAILILGWRILGFYEHLRKLS